MNIMNINEKEITMNSKQKYKAPHLTSYGPPFEEANWHLNGQLEPEDELPAPVLVEGLNHSFDPEHTLCPA
jgi:hypothetical protein